MPGPGPARPGPASVLRIRVVWRIGHAPRRVPRRRIRPGIPAGKASSMPAAAEAGGRASGRSNLTEFLRGISDSSVISRIFSVRKSCARGQRPAQRPDGASPARRASPASRSSRPSPSAAPRGAEGVPAPRGRDGGQSPGPRRAGPAAPHTQTIHVLLGGHSTEERSLSRPAVTSLSYHVPPSRLSLITSHGHVPVPHRANRPCAPRRAPCRGA